MSDEPRVVRDADPNYWMVIRPDGERVGGFKSEADAWRHIDRGRHLQPLNKPIKTLCGRRRDTDAPAEAATVNPA
jgi:hypothetical protein